MLKFTEIVILWVYYTIPFGFSLFWLFWGIDVQLLKLLCLAKDHWRGFSNRNAHMVHAVNLIRFKMMYTSWLRSLFLFQLLGVTVGGPVSHGAHVAKFYSRLRLIRSVLRASKFSVLKFTEIVILWVYYTIPFGFSLFLHFWGIDFQLLKLLCLAKDHWRGFSTQNAHMVHVVNLIRFKMVYTSWWRSMFVFVKGLLISKTDTIIKGPSNAKHVA